MRLTVIPSDRFMSKDGEKLFFDFTTDPNIHALQWHDDHGHVEYINPRHNEDIDEAFIAPHILAFVEEKIRLDDIAEAELAFYNSPAQVTLRAEQVEEAEIEVLIQAKLKEFAKDELKKEGKLNKDGKIVK